MATGQFAPTQLSSYMYLFILSTYINKKLWQKRLRIERNKIFKGILGAM